MEVTFVPRGIRAGDWHFGVGTAGSVTLVLQTLLPALMMAAAPSTLILEGGTHNPMAPPFEFIAEAWLPLVRRMGPRVKVKLDRHGFYPEGGGKVRVLIEPVSSLRPLILVERGPVVRCCATVLIGDLPRHVAEREMKVLKRELGLEAKAVRWEAIRSRSPVNVAWVTVETPGVTEVFTAFGAKGVRAETVAGQLAKTVLRYLEAGVPVGEHLADQLLLPLALAGGGTFVSLPLTSHSLTNIEVIERFLPVRIESQATGEESGSARCEVRMANGEAGGG
jgi:RNA 3'-terminal phosphate cyclase (ATP)